MPIVLENIIYNEENVPFGEKLRDVSVNIDDGEFIGVTGDRGDGASALLRIIGRAYPPLGGNVKVIDGNAVYADKRPERFLSEKTVEKQVALPISEKYSSQNELHRRCGEALKVFGLDIEGIGELSPFALTRCEARLVMYAEALTLEAEAILLDDPTEGMDAKRSIELMESLKKLNEGGKTVVIASRDTELLSKFARRAVIMKDGKIVRDGSAKSVYTEYYELLRLGIDVPDTVRCTRTLREHNVDMPVNVLKYEQFIDRLKIIMWRKAL